MFLLWYSGEVGGEGVPPPPPRLPIQAWSPLPPISRRSLAAAAPCSGFFCGSGGTSPASSPPLSPFRSVAPLFLPVVCLMSLVVDRSKRGYISIGLILPQANRKVIFPIFLFSGIPCQPNFFWLMVALHSDTVLTRLAGHHSFAAHSTGTYKRNFIATKNIF